MFPVRRAALRLLSTPSVSFAPRSRTITSFTSFASLRTHKQVSSLLYQKRWASDEVKKSEEETPVSQIQPTPQEEVENAIHEDHAAETTGNAEESVSDSSQQSVTDATAADSSVDTAGAISGSQYQTLDQRPARSENEPKPTIYIGNLFFDVTEDDLTKEFSRFGNIERVKIIRDSRGLSKGFGYVTFPSTKEATNAVEALNHQLFEGRRLKVSYAATDAPPALRGRPESSSFGPRNPPSSTLFIGNMSWDMTDRDLNNLFRGIKNVIDVRVAMDRRTGQPRGFAHADFTDVKSAMEAMKSLQGKETYGRRLRVDYSYGPSGAPKNQVRDEGDL